MQALYLYQMINFASTPSQGCLVSDLSLDISSLVVEKYDSWHLFKGVDTVGMSHLPPTKEQQIGFRQRFMVCVCPFYFGQLLQGLCFTFSIVYIHVATHLSHFLIQQDEMS